MLSIGLPSWTLAADPAAGPVSREEAAILWKDAEKAAQENRTLDVIPKLQRLLVRYPANEHTLEAQRLLALAWIDLQNYNEAIPLLKKMISASPRLKPGQTPVTLPQNEGRVLLARAYLGLDRLSEALLTANELLQSGDAEVQRRGRLARGWAELGLRQLPRARRTLHELESRGGEREVDTQTLALALSLQSCAQLAATRQASESVAKDQLHRRGLCLGESLITFGKLLSAAGETSADLEFVKAGADRIVRSVETFRDRCIDPPHPSAPPQRSPEQLKRYRNELVDQIWPVCRGQIETLSEQLSRLKQNAKPRFQSFLDLSMSALDQLRKLSLKPTS